MYIDWEWFVVIVGASASVGALINHAREIYAAAKRPRQEMQGSIDNMQSRIDSHIAESSRTQAENERRFKNDYDRMRRVETEMRLSLRCQLTQLTAQIDGDNKEELKKRRDELQEYLLNREIIGGEE